MDILTFLLQGKIDKITAFEQGMIDPQQIDVIHKYFLYLKKRMFIKHKDIRQT